MITNRDPKERGSWMEQLIESSVAAIKAARTEYGLEESRTRISRETMVEVFTQMEEGRSAIREHSRDFVEEYRKLDPSASEERVQQIFVQLAIQAFLEAQDKVLAEL